LIDYIIKKTDNKLYIAEEHNYLVKDQSFQKFINKILIIQLTNLTALEISTKKLFNFKNKIPLYLDSNNLLMCINSYRLTNSIYINYFAITSYESVNKDLYIYFRRGHCLKITGNHAFKSQINKCKQILNKTRKSNVLI